jgi:AraC-like DNA-binding protein
MHSSTLPPSFLVAYHAKTVGEALQRVARFKTLTAPEEILLRTEGNRCTITTAWAYANRQEPSALTDASFSFLVNMVRAGSGKPIRPLALTLCRNPSEALQSWFDCPITWNARQACLVFDRADLDIPFLSYNRELLEMLDRALDADLNRAAQNVTLADQVRWHLRRALTAGRPELCTIARDMAISERSLQRRLQSEGHSFKSLGSETRRQVARVYLADPELEISETAYLLGYEDQGSFFRAFRKWENQTPAEWRSAQGG